MRRGPLLVALILHGLALAAVAQAPGVLHIKVALTNARGTPTPIARHALLISDNPNTISPLRVVTGVDGTVDVRLRPGNYTVESDEPLVFEGQAHIWTKTLDIAAGRDAVLELTSGNVEIVPLSTATTTSGRSLDGAESRARQWQDSVVAIWTPTTHASGFLFDANGLIATNQRNIGTATSAEVQLTPAVKVAANTVVADAVRDVAILRIDPAAVAALRPLPLGCGDQPKPPENGEAIVALAATLRQEQGSTFGTVIRVDAHAILSDLYLGIGGAGGPVFAARGLIGLTAPDDETTRRRQGKAHVVRLDQVCDAANVALTKMNDSPAPEGTHLPVEPAQPFPVDALKNAAEKRAGSLSPYRLSSSAFDVAFITPVMTFAAQYQSELTARRGRGRGERPGPAAPSPVPPLLEFNNWSEYVAAYPPVLLVRVRPKMAEGFWTKVGRAAAYTQGVDLPPIKRFTSGFLRMRTFCGEAEIMPIHPLKIEQRVSETDAVYEGLYVFDPGSLGPACGTVKLVLYSEKEPAKGGTETVDPAIIQQIWQDFAPYRAAK